MKLATKYQARSRRSYRSIQSNGSGGSGVLPRLTRSLAGLLTLLMLAQGGTAAQLSSLSSGLASGAGTSGWAMRTTGAAFRDRISASATHIATFEVEAPPAGITEWVVRGNVPVPKGTYFSADPLRSRLSLRTYDDRAVATQTVGVTWYPNRDVDGADVVQLSGRIPVPPYLQPGERFRVEVVQREHIARPADFNFTPDIAALATQSGKVLLEAEDVFGNLYVCDLINASGDYFRSLQRGRWMHAWRTHSTLMPVSPIASGQPNATLPHLMGVHAYFTARSDEDVLEVALHVHNGHAGNDPNNPVDDALGDIYFERLELRVPSGWNIQAAFDGPLTGTVRQESDSTVYSLIEPRSDGRMHYMPRQAQFVRHLSVNQPAANLRARAYLDGRDILFSRRGANSEGETLWSWWNKDTAAYFPYDVRVPELDHEPPHDWRLEMDAKLQVLLDLISTGGTGPYPHEFPLLGWAHPWGIRHGGQAGGTDIHQVDGLRTLEGASRSGLRYHRLKSRMYTDRNPLALYDADGSISEVEEWIVQGPHGPYLATWYFLRPLLFAADPFGFTSSPDHQRQYVEANDLQPSYYDDLSHFQAIDFQHYTRATTPLKTLVWLENDWVAKDLLRMQAEAFRLSYNTWNNSQGGMHIGTGLKEDLLYSAAHPGQTLNFGRGEGWAVDAVNAVYAFESNSERAKWRPWYDKILEAVERGQSPCTGIIFSAVQEQGFNGMFRQKQNTEQVIVENALIGMRECVYRGASPADVARLDAILTASCYHTISNTGWSFEGKAPYARLAVGPIDPDGTNFCDNVPAAGQADWFDRNQSWSTLANGYRMTNDFLFLRRAMDMAGTEQTVQALLDELLDAEYPLYHNQAELISLLQELVGNG